MALGVQPVKLKREVLRLCQVTGINGKAAPGKAVREAINSAVVC